MEIFMRRLKYDESFVNMLMGCSDDNYELLEENFSAEAKKGLLEAFWAVKLGEL
jgi:hypothetical protein